MGRVRLGLGFGSALQGNNPLLLPVVVVLLVRFLSLISALSRVLCCVNISFLDLLWVLVLKDLGFGFYSIWQTVEGVWISDWILELTAPINLALSEKNPTPVPPPLGTSVNLNLNLN